MLRVKQFEFSMFGVNTYLAIDEDTKETAVIDPAMYDEYEQSVFDKYIKDNGLHLTQIINTHLHLDHCFGLNYVKNRYGVVVKAHPDDAILGRNMSMQYRKFGMVAPAESVEIDVPLKDGDIITIGHSQLTVLHVPGHSRGSIALYDAESRLLFSGDTLFRGSIGRTDLEGGDYQQLSESIHNKLYTLPDDVNVLPGHSGFTTIGYEKRNNRYV